MHSFKDFAANDNMYKVTIKGKSDIPNTGKTNYKWNSNDGIHYTVKNWHDNHIKHNDGNSVTTTDAYTHYLNNTDEGRHVSLPMFNRQWKEYSKHRVQDIAGRTRHLGVSFRKSNHKTIRGNQ